jgi:hypothetical protein
VTRLYAILVDMSGSMEPAFDKAMGLVFDLAARAPAAFIVAGFREREPREAPPGSVHRFQNECGEGYIIDYGAAWAALGVRRLRRGGIPVPASFRGRTPLNAALLAFARMVARRGVPFELHVVSDNRDTCSTCRSDRVAEELRRIPGLRRTVLHCVGNCLRRYTEPYDEVVVEAPALTFL